MRIEEREVRDRMEAARSAGDAMGREIAGMLTRLEKQGHFANRPWDEDAELCEQLLETLTDAPHFADREDDIDARGVIKSAARRHWAMIISEADRDLRFAETAYMDRHWFDHLADLEADERAMARAS